MTKHRSLPDPKRWATRVALGFAMAALLSPMSAAAQGSQPTFGLHPVLAGVTTLSHGHFRYALSAGSSIQDGVVVQNFSDQPLTIDVYGADMLQAQGGGVAPAQEDQPQHQVGAWLTVSQPTLMVPARTEVTDAFVLSMPVGVTPGEHLGAVVAAATVGRAGGVSIQGRAALTVEVVVPGVVRPSATLGSLHGVQGKDRTYSFAVALANTGNVQLTTAGTVDVTDSEGRIIDSLPLLPKEANAVPSGTLDLHTGPSTFTNGNFTVQAHVTTYVNGKPVQRYSSNQLHYAFVDWTRVVLVVAAGMPILAAIMYMAGRVRRRRRRRKQVWQDALRRHALL